MNLLLLYRIFIVFVFIGMCCCYSKQNIHNEDKEAQVLKGYREIRRVSPPDSVLAFLAELYDMDDKESFYAALDSIEIVNCGFWTNYAPPYIAWPPYEFDVENDSIRVSIILVDNEQKLSKILISKNLTRGHYLIHSGLFEAIYFRKGVESLFMVERMGNQEKRLSRGDLLEILRKNANK